MGSQVIEQIRARARSVRGLRFGHPLEVRVETWWCTGKQALVALFGSDDLAKQTPRYRHTNSHMTCATRQTGAWPAATAFLASHHGNHLSYVSSMSGDDDSSGWQLTESDPGVFTYVHVVVKAFSSESAYQNTPASCLKHSASTWLSTISTL